MGLQEIIPSIALILVLILVLPQFIKSNLKKKVFFKNTLVFKFDFMKPGRTRINTNIKAIEGIISSNPIS